MVVADDAESGVDGDELDGVVGGVADEGSLNGEGLRGRGMLWASRTAPAVDATEETGGGRRCRLQDKVEVIAVGRARLPLAAARAGADEESCARHGIVVAKARLVAMAGGEVSHGGCGGCGRRRGRRRWGSQKTCRRRDYPHAVVRASLSKFLSISTISTPLDPASNCISSE